MDFNGLPWTSRRVDGRGVDGSRVLSGNARKPWRFCCSFRADDRIGSTVEVMFDPSQPTGIAAATRGGHLQVGRVQRDEAKVLCSCEGDDRILEATQPGVLAIDGRDVPPGDRFVVPLGSCIKVREAQGRMTVSQLELHRWREPLAGFERTVVCEGRATGHLLGPGEFATVA